MHPAGRWFGTKLASPNRTTRGCQNGTRLTDHARPIQAML